MKRNINLNELLNRNSINFDLKKMLAFFHKKSVLITGASGSIGVELCKQVLSFEPKKLILLGRRESVLLLLKKELEQDSKTKIIASVVDIYDANCTHKVIHFFQPNIILHSAAEKYISLLEKEPKRALKVNIIGTLNIIEASISANIQTCMVLSSNKANTPISVMGASKRIVEILCQSFTTTKTRIAVIR